MRRGARAFFKPRPFCSLSDARAAVIPVYRNAGSDAVWRGSRYSSTQERWIWCRLVPYIHTSHSGLLECLRVLDLMSSCPVYPYLTSRSGISLSLSLSFSLSFFVFAFLSLPFWWVSRFLTDCIYYIAFYFVFFTAFFNDLGSVSCARPDSFVMPSASLGTPGSHTPAGNFPFTRHTVAHGYTTVSFTSTVSSGSK